MKFNKWTLGLAAVGAVSLVSVAQAEEKGNSVMTTVSSTILSGYVDTSAEWNPGTGNAHVANFKYNAGKQDGFNLDSILISLEKPMDETEWSAGYKVDLMYGPDANRLGTSLGSLVNSDFAIRQAYVALRTPVGNGIDWKLGVFDSIIGYESTDSVKDPNFTRSYGHTIEPSTHTGLLGSYRVADWLMVQAGIADTTGPLIGGQTPAAGNGFDIPFNGYNYGSANPPKAESYKTYMASIALTAPSDWGVLGGSMLYGGFVNGWGGGANQVGSANAPGGTTTSFYAGATINTGVTGLRVGASYDYIGRQSQNYSFGTFTYGEFWANAIALYASFQATEKLSFHGRAEYFWETGHVASGNMGPVPGPDKVFALTGTAQYDLWKNVLSRVEFRWDHQAGNPTGGGSGGYYGGTFTGEGITGATKHDAFILAANVIYKF